jgi:hypothetical protein
MMGITHLGHADPVVLYCKRFKGLVCDDLNAKRTVSRFCTSKESSKAVNMKFVYVTRNQKINTGYEFITIK